MKRSISNNVRSPGSYSGGEWGAVVKESTGREVKWALAFPDAYSIGMSHLGLQIIYHILNSNPKSSAERVFAPWNDMRDALEKDGSKLYGLETGRPLDTFDVVGFSLLYELGFTNVLAMLDLGGVPRRASERRDGHPIVIAGGPCSANPAPMEVFFDAFVVGEGEEVVVEINDVVYEAKNSGRKRDEIISKLAGIEGVYVPAVHAGSKSNLKIAARRVADLDSAPFPTKPVVASVEATHDRAVVEVARGCPHACRFCHAGFIMRPYRERKPATALRLATEIVKNTGYEDVTFLSLSAGDYGCLIDLVSALSSRFAGQGVAVNLPSLRAGSLTESVVDRIKSMRKTGFTIAPEAGSARLRNVISKNISNDDIIETARIVFRGGWDLIKLYFMFGLPTETEDDIRELADLVKAIRREGFAVGKRPKINVSLSAFVPKPHTPFQWDGMIDEREIAYRLDFARHKLDVPGVTVKWSPAFMSMLEGVFARGTTDLADVLEKAVANGARFDAWGEELRIDAWRKAFDDAGFDARAFASRSIPVNDPLPWSHIDMGVAREWLVEEREKAFVGATTLGCENDPCPDRCGGCDGTAKANVERDSGLSVEPPAEKPVRENYRRIRLVYAKTGAAAWLGHLDTMRTLQRALRRAGLKMLYTEGFHPKLKMSFGPAMPVGIESECEMIDAWVHKDHSPEDVVKAFGENCPAGFASKGAVELEEKAPAIEKSVTSEIYVYELYLGSDDKSTLISSLSRFNEADEWILEKDTKSGVRRVDLKAAVEAIAIIKDGAIEMCLTRGAGVGPKAVFEAIFGPPPAESRIIKTAAREA